MTDDADDDAAKSGPREWQRPSWRRIGEFVLNVYELQRTVKSLQSQLKEQQDETRRLQMLVEKQTGHIEAVMSFINTSLRNEMETKAERAAMRLIERLLDLKIDPPTGDS